MAFASSPPRAGPAKNPTINAVSRHAKRYVLNLGDEACSVASPMTANENESTEKYPPEEDAIAYKCVVARVSHSGLSKHKQYPGWLSRTVQTTSTVKESTHVFPIHTGAAAGRAASASVASIEPVYGTSAAAFLPRESAIMATHATVISAGSEQHRL